METFACLRERSFLGEIQMSNFNALKKTTIHRPRRKLPHEPASLH